MTLVWLAPWAAALGLEAGLLFSATAGSFLFLVYNFWSTTFPWNYANSDAVGDWSGYIVHYELMTWIVVLVIAVVIYPAFLWTRWYRPAPASAGIERWRNAGRIASVLTASLVLVMAYVDLKAGRCDRRAVSLDLEDLAVASVDEIHVAPHRAASAGARAGIL
jgi:hypothetical protein